MSNYRFFLLVLSAIFIVTGNVMGTTADTVLVNGQFYTVDEDNVWAEAVAIEDGIIVYVGSEEGVGSFIGEGTAVIDLEGKFAMPSFVEGHLHPLSTAYAYNFTAILYDLYSHEEYIQAITAFAVAHPAMDGIMGNGFATSLYGSAGPRKETLDAIDSDRPIGIISDDIHAMWVNSKALELAGITASTPNPEGGIIVKDPTTGEPTGLLREMPAMSLVWNILPAPSKEEYKTSLLWAQEFLNKVGITTAHDAWVEFDPNYYNAYNELANEGLLTVRFRGAWYIDPNSEYSFSEDIDYGFSLSESFTHPHFQVNAFKFLADGTLEEGTALLAEPYNNQASFYGMKNWTNSNLASAFTKVDNANYQIHVHSIGDSAASYTLDAIEQLGGTQNRPSIAHLQLIKPQDIIRMGELNVSAHMQQYWMVKTEAYNDIYLPALGSVRADNTYPIKSIFDAGVNITVGSDWPTSEPKPLLAIYNGMTRSNVGDEQLPPASEYLSLEQMLKAATINGAYANILENEIGSIQVGKKADIIVLSKNLFEIDTEEIPNVEIEMTFFEGKLVFSKNITGITNLNPTNITLKQNFPNPFDLTTTIQFSLEKNQNVKLSVFDIQGNKIAIIIKDSMIAGKHSIEFDGSKLTSGQYFYKIETEDFTEIRRMILLK